MSINAEIDPFSRPQSPPDSDAGPGSGPSTGVRTGPNDEPAGNAMAVADLPQPAAMLPQTGAMCLLERIEAFSEAGLVASGCPHRLEPHPLASDGVLPASAALEYAAQGIALHAILRQLQKYGSLRASTGKGESYMVALKRVRWHREALDEAPGPLSVAVTAVALIEAGAQYDFEVYDAVGVSRASGTAIVAM